MDKKMLASVVEGILFVAGDGVELKDIAEKLEVKLDDVKKAVEQLKEKHTEDDGINVITYKTKAQLTSNPKFAEQIETVLNPIKERALTKAALETIAIIAYQQPITRLEIEQVRGVSCDYAIQVLLNHNLIEVVGRKDAVGKPLLFGTTDQFLKKFEIQSLEDLPKYEELLSRIQVIKNEGNSLYREYDVLSPDEAEKLEKQQAETTEQQEGSTEQENETEAKQEQPDEVFVEDEFDEQKEEDEEQFDDDFDEEDLTDETAEDDESDEVDPIFKEPFDDEDDDEEKEEYEKFLGI